MSSVELSAVLGAAYESFLKARLERRAARRGKVHARALVMFADVVTEMAADAGGDTKAVRLMVIAELDRDRAEIEADVLADGAMVEVVHEWAAFLGWLASSVGAADVGGRGTEE